MPVEKTPAPCRTAARHARTTAHDGAGRFFGTAAKGSRTAPQGKRSPAPRTDVPDAPSPCCVRPARDDGAIPGPDVSAPGERARAAKSAPPVHGTGPDRRAELRRTGPRHRRTGPAHRWPAESLPATTLRTDAAQAPETDTANDVPDGGRRKRETGRSEEKTPEHTGKRFIFRTFVHMSSVRHRTARAPAERAAAPANRSAKPESHT